MTREDALRVIASGINKLSLIYDTRYAKDAHRAELDELVRAFRTGDLDAVLGLDPGECIARQDTARATA